MDKIDTCKICGAKVEAQNHFHRAHKLRQSEYYERHFNRRDLWDNTPITFKNLDQYFGTDFNNKNNLKKYLKSIGDERARDYCKDLLSKRKEQKNLVYAPTQVELRSLPAFPPAHYLHSLFGDYYDVCRELSFVNKFISLTEPIVYSEIPSGGYIIVDSRESTPLKFDIPIRVQKLDFGDYASSWNSKIYFERKSLADFIMTFNQGIDRFKNEALRAQNAGVYLIVLVENVLSEALTFNYLPWMKRVKTKATPEFIFHNVRELIQEFPNLQFLFVNGRKQCSEYIIKGFCAGNVFSEFDLQFAYDTKII